MLLGFLITCFSGAGMRASGLVLSIVAVLVRQGH